MNKMLSVWLRLNLATRFVWIMFFYLLCLETFARLGFALYFKPNHLPVWQMEWLKVLGFGLRFDSRWVITSLLPIWFIGSILDLILDTSVRKPSFLRYFYFIYTHLLLLLWFVIYCLDFGFYAYLSERFNITALHLASDYKEAASVIWYHYPIIRLALLFLILARCSHVIFKAAWQQSSNQKERKENTIPITYWSLFGVISWLLICVMTYGIFFVLIKGKTWPESLSWRDISHLPHTFYQTAATAPLENLRESLKFQTKINSEDMQQTIPVISHYLTEGMSPKSLPLATETPLLRLHHQEPLLPVFYSRKPPTNVVLIVLESFASHQVGYLGNPLNPTPFFDTLCQQGILFPGTIAATQQTVAGLSAILTGIPNVNPRERSLFDDPRALDQQLVLSTFDQNQIFYMTTGDPEWGGFIHLSQFNLKHFKILSEKDWHSPKISTWGISDKDMFLEADQILNQQQTPFFTLIQTTGNHPPNIIPPNDLADINPPTHTTQTLLNAGFSSQDEYNGLRYMDFALQTFFTQAKQHNYFKHTLFVLVGDHGKSNQQLNTQIEYGKAFHLLGLTRNQVPLLFYAPGWLKPIRINHWAQQVDIMPSIAALLNQSKHSPPVLNTTLGRNLFNSQLKTHLAYTFEISTKKHGLLFDHYYLTAQENDQGQLGSPMLYDLNDPETPITPFPNLTIKQIPAIDFLWGYRNTALYLQTHNKHITKNTP
jgi:glucan phosphoethanolaminetransferase (alkaline phosphatase superfamily)